MTNGLAAVLPLALAAAEKKQSGGAFGLLGTLLPIVALIVIFYFLLVRPQQKRAQAHQRLIGEVQPGDEVVTIGGMFGDVVELGDERVTIEVYDGTQIEFLRTAISRRVVPGGPAAAESSAGTDDDAELVEEPPEETGPDSADTKQR